MVNLTINKVEFILNDLGKVPHPLLGKSISKWEKTDKLNWNALIRNTKYERFMR